MKPSRFLRGGVYLGEADIMRRRKLDGASVMKNAAGQFNVSGSEHGKKAGGMAQQIARDFKGQSGQIGIALQYAQEAGGSGYQAVSCGWWLGQAYGCCKYKLGDIQSDQLMGFVLKASEHALALSRDNDSSWKKGDIDREFGVVAEALDGIKIGDLPSYADRVSALASRFAATLG